MWWLGTADGVPRYHVYLFAEMEKRPTKATKGRKNLYGLWKYISEFHQNGQFLRKPGLENSQIRSQRQTNLSQSHAFPYLAPQLVLLPQVGLLLDSQPVHNSIS